MDKIKLIVTEFWEATQIMARANPKKTAFLVIAASVIGFILGRITG